MRSAAASSAGAAGWEIEMAMSDGIEGYDLIGDVHGCGATLAALLEKLTLVEDLC